MLRAVIKAISDYTCQQYITRYYVCVRTVKLGMTKEALLSQIIRILQPFGALMFLQAPACPQQSALFFGACFIDIRPLVLGSFSVR